MNCTGNKSSTPSDNYQYNIELEDHASFQSIKRKPHQQTILNEVPKRKRDDNYHNLPLKKRNPRYSFHVDNKNKETMDTPSRTIARGMLDQVQSVNQLDPTKYLACASEYQPLVATGLGFQSSLNLPRCQSNTFSLALQNHLSQEIVDSCFKAKSEIDFKKMSNESFMSQMVGFLQTKESSSLLLDQSAQRSHSGNSLSSPFFPQLPKELALSEDKEYLSEHQCLLRRNIELFMASEEDMSNYLRGRNWSVEKGQVGIRCKHCNGSSTNEKNRSSRYFPLSLLGIYQAAQNIYHFHFKAHCPQMPAEVQDQFDNVKPTRSCYSGGKQYWIRSAEAIGIEETSSGLRLKQSSSSSGILSSSQKKNGDLGSPKQECLNIDFDKKGLVCRDDRNLVTDYIFFLMSQMMQHTPETNESTTCFALMCKHCHGRNGTGVFNRTKISTMSKNDYFTRVQGHLDKCDRCPDDIKNRLKEFHKTHDYQKRQLKRGNRKIFLARILDRLEKSRNKI